MVLYITFYALKLHGIVENSTGKENKSNLCSLYQTLILVDPCRKWNSAKVDSGRDDVCNLTLPSFLYWL